MDIQYHVRFYQYLPNRINKAIVIPREYQEIEKPDSASILNYGVLSIIASDDRKAFDLISSLPFMQPIEEPAGWIPILLTANNNRDDLINDLMASFDQIRSQYAIELLDKDINGFIVWLPLTDTQDKRLKFLTQVFDMADLQIEDYKPRVIHYVAEPDDRPISGSTYMRWARPKFWERK